MRTEGKRVYLFYIYTKHADASSAVISDPSTTGEIGKWEQVCPSPSRTTIQQ